jgi:hypothetical protein
MQQSWSLREEIYQVSQRWPVILVFILTGALVGAMVAWIIPAPFQAISDIYVGLDVYRAMQDMNIPIRPEGANDYKNWQMENLKLVMTSQPVINETIKRLRQEDGYWNNVNKKSLASMLKVYWRSAGKWRLAAEHPNPQLALHALDVWKTTALAEVHSAIEKSQEVLVLDALIQANAAQVAELSARQAQISQAMVEIENLSDRIASTSYEAVQSQSATKPPATKPPAVKPPTGTEGASISKEPDGDMQQELIAELIAIILSADLLPPDSPLWSSFPPETSAGCEAAGCEATSPGATSGDYQEWLAQLTNLLQLTSMNIQAQMDQLNFEMEVLRERYSEAGAASWGLSANLIVESQDDLPPEMMKIRPLGQMMLLGTLVGFLVWLFLQLIRITLRARNA